jgi:hypothetical protein
MKCLVLCLLLGKACALDWLLECASHPAGVGNLSFVATLAQSEKSHDDDCTIKPLMTHKRQMQSTTAAPPPPSPSPPPPSSLPLPPPPSPPPPPAMPPPLPPPLPPPTPPPSSPPSPPPTPSPPPSPPPTPPPSPPPQPPPQPPFLPPLFPPPPPLIDPQLRSAFALAVILPLVGLLVVFSTAVVVRTRLTPKFTAAERTSLQRTWMPSTLLRVLLRHPNVADAADELVPLTMRTQHFYSPVRCCLSTLDPWVALSLSVVGYLARCSHGS